MEPIYMLHSVQIQIHITDFHEFDDLSLQIPIATWSRRREKLEIIAISGLPAARCF